MWGVCRYDAGVASEGLARGRRLGQVWLAGGLAGAMLLVAGCGDAVEQVQGALSSGEDTGSEAAEVTAADAGEADASAEAGEAAEAAEEVEEVEEVEDGPKELSTYSEELHDVPMPAPGTAEVRVGGVTYLVEDISCDWDDEYVYFSERGESPDGETIEIYAWRGSQGLENEGLQLTIVGGSDERELNAIGIIQAERVAGGAHYFLQGDGDSYPVIRAVEDQITGMGTFQGSDEVRGEFTMAADCG